MKLFIYLILSFALSCNSSKEKADEANAQKEATVQAETKEMNAELINQGYHVGTIKEVRSGECTFIIIDEKTKVEFDPINFKEDTFSAMRKNNQKVYYKYNPLRMMNRCGNYQPIQITDCKPY